MNGLSWLIYLASLSDGASQFLSVSSFFGGLVAAIGLLLSILWTDGSYGGERRFKGYEQMNKSGQRLWPRGLLAFFVFGSIAIVLPSKNTVLAIAASEVGERVMKSEQVQGIADDATKALQQWIKKQIEPEAKK